MMEGCSTSFPVLGGDSSLYAGMAKDQINDSNVSEVTNQLSKLTLISKNYEEPRKEILTGEHKRGVWRVCSIGNDKLATASYDHSAKICSAIEDKEIFTLTGHKKEVLSLALVDQNKIATGSSDGMIKIWNLKNGKFLSNIQEDEKHRAGIYSLIYQKNQNRFVSGSCQKPKNEKRWEYMLKFWNADTKQFCFGIKGHQGGISKIVDLGNDRLVTSSGDKTLKVWDTQKRSVIANFAEHKDYVYSVAKINDETVVSGSRDISIRLWTIEKNVHELLSGPERDNQGHASTVYDVATYGECILASASRDGYVKLWDLRTKKTIKSLDVSAGFAYSVAFTDDGKIIVGYSGKASKPKEGGGAAIWDFAKK